MFQFRAFPTLPYLIQVRLIRYCRTGFPHSEISGSMRMCRSPKLIAACHVLLRLLMPRHSPCALISLTFVRRNFISSPSARCAKLDPFRSFFLSKTRSSVFLYSDHFWFSELCRFQKNSHSCFYCSFYPIISTILLEMFLKFLRLSPLLPCLICLLFIVQFSRCNPGQRPDQNTQNTLECFDPFFTGGEYRTRTDDPLRAKQVLSQLS